VSFHRDKSGIIGQPIDDGGRIEGGDSACWMGHYIYLTNDQTFPYVETFEKRLGGYVRHPDPDMTNNGFGALCADSFDGCISRDQLTGILLALIAQKKRVATLALLLDHMFRLFLFAYNTIPNGADPETSKRKMPDLTLFDIWALEIRSLGLFGLILYPLLCVFDLHVLFAVLIDRIGFNRKDNDVINLAGKLIAGKEHLPTPISLLAFKLADKRSLMVRITDYWSGFRDNKGFIPLFEGKLNG
jgi:hypothetical protein